MAEIAETESSEPKAAVAEKTRHRRLSLLWRTIIVVLSVLVVLVAMDQLRALYFLGHWKLAGIRGALQRALASPSGGFPSDE